MKKQLLTLLLAAPFILSAQTATNFTANDCAGNSHDLFAELNAGKVIVISWVMPCAGCITASQTAYGIVQSYATSNPGQVLMYVADDYANTTCNTLNNWVNANNMPNVTTFSDAALDMTDYGGVGMPKIIVVGGGFNHTLYFNANNSAANNATGIQNAIDSALADVTGMSTPATALANISLFPNPANGSSSINISATQANDVTIELYNALGETVMQVYSGTLAQGENRIALNTGALAEGIYFISIREAAKTSMQKLVISH